MSGFGRVRFFTYLSAAHQDKQNHQWHGKGKHKIWENQRFWRNIFRLGQIWPYSVLRNLLPPRTSHMHMRNVVFLQRYILFSAYTNFGGDFCGCLRQRLMACVGFVACRGWLSLQVREIIGNFLGIFPKSLYLCIVNQIKQRLSDNMFNNLKILDYETEWWKQGRKSSFNGRVGECIRW